MIKNVFYLTLKALFVLKIFKFLSSFFGHAEKQLDQKYKVYFKIYDVTTWETNNYITHIAQLPISRSKNNQTMKFGQLKEYKLRNIFLQKSYTKCGGEAIPRRFYQKSILSASLNLQPKVLYSLFLLYAKLRTIIIY